MNTTVIFIIGVIVGGVVVWFASPAGQKKKIPARNRRQMAQKEERKQKIVSEIEKHGEITNNDVEELLGVSDATATRYLQELEDEGVVEQIGRRGRFVTYQLRK